MLSYRCLMMDTNHLELETATGEKPKCIGSTTGIMPILFPWSIGLSTSLRALAFIVVGI
uniref:Uncharacterized protein n=1 Tax=Picea glauca TaxID=3330 RepID=A0A124GML8_PICGL|nr:hypothetical protein ABT39_MTgene1892 [Picea glauca]QHR92533.1 hypothetical protein Q903MT_gene6579 [Picea sitchensis]